MGVCSLNVIYRSPLIALQDDDPKIRQFSAITLSRKRSNHALPYLIESYKKEKIDVIAVSMATAIVASGAKGVRSLYHPELNLPAITLWQCILAMRTRDESFADKIVNIACDAQQNWQLRHIAILAAGRLPFEVALEKIFGQILSERSSLVIDQSSALMRHSQISSLLLKEAIGVYRVFNSGKQYFVNFWAEIFDHWLKNQLHTHGAPNGKETAEWLFDRVEYYGFPQSTLVADQIISELHIPVLHAAVLRSLRLCGRLDIIEQYIMRTYHEWFTAKCIKEIMKLEKPSCQLAEKLKALVQQSKFKDSYYLGRVIDDYCFQGLFSQKNTPETIMGEGLKKEGDYSVS